MKDTERFLDPAPRADDVPAEAPFSAWRLKVLSSSELEALGSGAEISEAQLAYLAWHALLAPTSHNTVPQRMLLLPRERAIRIFVDRSAVLAESDPVGRQATVSVGCAIANVALAAQVYGWSCQCDVPAERELAAQSSTDSLAEVATLRFLKGDAPPLDPTWLLAMRRRKTVRAEYDEGVPLPPELAEELCRRASALDPGLTLHVVTDSPTRFFLGKFQELADSTVINRERFAREMGDWLLENDSAAWLGMRGREFGLDDETARRMHRGLQGLERLLPDETAGFAKAGSLGMRSSSAVAVITVNKDDLAHRLAAGRAFEEIALRLWLDGFCTAMHAGITEVEPPNLALRGRLRTTHRPTVVFRIGKPLHPLEGDRPHSSRPLLDAVLVSR